LNPTEEKKYLDKVFYKKYLTGKALRAIHLLSGLTQTFVCEQNKIHIDTLQRLFKDERKMPKTRYRLYLYYYKVAQVSRAA